MKQSNLRNMLIGFAVVGAGLGGTDGYMIGGDAAWIGAGALMGAFIGAGLVLLASRPKPQDRASAAERLAEADHPNYLGIWALLFVLTIVEVGVAFTALSQVQIIVALLVLAVWKAVLVALYYMHLKFEPRRMWLLAASPLPLALIFVFAVLAEGW